MQAQECFIVSERGKVLKSQGRCDKAYPPNSTFKIPLGLMGFDAKILSTASSPTWPFKSGYLAGPNVCRSAHTPKEWMRDSCVWFSQVLTTKLGIEKFKSYVERFSYGNMDISGDSGMTNGLTNSWLSSSLLITPHQQLDFLQRMLDGKLTVSTAALKHTKDILFLQELAGGWGLYGKTGNGRGANSLQQGWFVGWIEKDARRLIFAQHIADEKPQDTHASFRARNEVLTKLWYLIDELAK